MKLLFSPEFRAPFPNVMRWFNTCVNQPQFTVSKRSPRHPFTQLLATTHACITHVRIVNVQTAYILAATPATTGSHDY